MTYDVSFLLKVSAVHAGDILYVDPKESDSILNTFENLLSDESVRNIREVHPVQADQHGNIFIKIHAKPGAKSNKIIATKINRIGVRISAPPVDGKANKELLKYLSKVLNVRKSALNIVEGEYTVLKTIKLEAGLLSLIDIVKKFLSLLEPRGKIVN